MVNPLEQELEPPAAEEEAPRGWQPSRRPSHRLDGADVDSDARIIEVGDEGGLLQRLRAYFRRPFVRLVAGVGLFVLAAIVYDATLNYREWTMKPEGLKAAPHKGIASGAAPVPETPN